MWNFEIEVNMTHLAMEQICSSTKGTPDWKQAVEPTNSATHKARLYTFRNNILIDMYSIQQPDSDKDNQRTYTVSGRQ